MPAVLTRILGVISSKVSALVSCTTLSFCKSIFPIITYKAFFCKQPSYLHSLPTTVRKTIQLRSSSSDLPFAPKVNTNIEIIVFLQLHLLFDIRFPVVLDLHRCCGH